MTIYNWTEHATTLPTGEVVSVWKANSPVYIRWVKRDCDERGYFWRWHFSECGELECTSAKCWCHQDGEVFGTLSEAIEQCEQVL